MKLQLFARELLFTLQENSYVRNCYLPSKLFFESLVEFAQGGLGRANRAARMGSPKAGLLLGVGTVGNQPLDSAFDAFRATWALAAVIVGLALVASEARERTRPALARDTAI